ncbi:protein associated with UVRAG as autophagy enhancer [Spea bombifrons]|uniref:protein associated with UVRAG as autophagy enhancer n=1 Tax=Spea bombifrons TaxID=233779 RepID=UPI002349B90B|nr:protein associated with UVRAG as autophagy enhancer [Spea bombifrons]
MTSSYIPVKTMAVSNPISMLPRMPTILFPADELPRPAVIGLAGSRGSYTDSTTAIKEILASVLNIPSSFKSKLSTSMDLEDSDPEYWESSNNGDSDTDSDSYCVPLISCAQNDVRFNRHAACWDNSQTDSPGSSTSDPPSLSPKIPIVNPSSDVAEFELSPFAKHGQCASIDFSLSDFPQKLNLPIQKDARRFSSPNLESHHLNFGQHLSNLGSDVLPLTCVTNAAGPEHCCVEDDKSFHRSQSYSSIQKASDKVLDSSTDPLPHSTEKLFEPAVNLENENEHFLVADMFISVFEKMKSNLQGLQYENWKSRRGLYRLPRDLREDCFFRKKYNSESAASVDSGYDGFAATQQNSPSDPILEEVDTKLSSKCDACEDEDGGYYNDEFVIIELEDYEKLCAPASKQSETTPEWPSPAPGSNSAEETAKKLYRAFRQQWLQISGECQETGSADHCADRLMSAHAIPEEFESSLNLEEEIKKFRLREAKEWSSPRFQIITNIHPYVKRDVVVASQNYLCVGCGTKVEPRYTSRLRYCEYLGKYFCDCCHSYAESPIPARILSKWNFSKYYVSNFSKNLLDGIWESHKFNIQCENPALYMKVRDLNRVKELQQQLIHLKRLLTTCRLADSVLKAFEDVPSYLTEELHVFTLNDLLKVKQRTLVTSLRELLHTGTAHVENCELCQAKGFICEFCQAKDVLFAFQTETCARCEGCKACFHKKCFKNNDCPKCRRIQAREACKRSTSPILQDAESDFIPVQ